MGSASYDERSLLGATMTSPRIVLRCRGFTIRVLGSRRDVRTSRTCNQQDEIESAGEEPGPEEGDPLADPDSLGPAIGCYPRFV